MELYRTVVNHHLEQVDTVSLISVFYAIGIAGSTQKPEDMYRIIEHFSLGRRRLELFGEDHNIRSGWLTAGKELSSSNFNAEVQYHSET